MWTRQWFQIGCRIEHLARHTYSDFSLWSLSKWSTRSSIIGLYDIFLQDKDKKIESRFTLQYITHGQGGIEAPVDAARLTDVSSHGISSFRGSVY